MYNADTNGSAVSTNHWLEIWLTFLSILFQITYFPLFLKGGEGAIGFRSNGSNKQLKSRNYLASERSIKLIVSYLQSKTTKSRYLFSQKSSIVVVGLDCKYIFAKVLFFPPYRNILKYIKNNILPSAIVTTWL